LSRSDQAVGGTFRNVETVSGAAKVVGTTLYDGFDSLPLYEPDRWTVASRYCKAAERVHKLGREIRYLKEAIRLGGQWAGTLYRILAVTDR
jgi:hypothetical protein